MVNQAKNLQSQVNEATEKVARFEVLSGQILRKTEQIKSLTDMLKDMFNSNSTSVSKNGVLSARPVEYESNYSVNVENIINLLDKDRIEVEKGLKKAKKK